MFAIRILASAFASSFNGSGTDLPRHLRLDTTNRASWMPQLQMQKNAGALAAFAFMMMRFVTKGFIERTMLVDDWLKYFGKS